MLPYDMIQLLYPSWYGDTSSHSRFNVVLVALALGRDLDGVALGDDVDVALEVPLGAARDVLRVGQ